MQALIGIVQLTLKSAFRNRLILFILIGLLGGVVALPALIQHDETAKGFTQIVLSYTLSFTVFLLGVVSLWVACWALARDIEESQIQMVAVKPIPRWKMWVGKWLGVMCVNAVCLGAAGLFVFFLLLWKSGELPDQERTVLRNEVLVSRGIVTPDLPDMDQMVEEEFQRRVAENNIPSTEWDAVRENLRETLDAQMQLVSPGFAKLWALDFRGLKERLKDEPLFLRANFQTAYALRNDEDPNYYPMVWVFGDPERPDRSQRPRELNASQWNTIEIPPGMINDEGILHVEVRNYSRDSMLFPLGDSLEVLYREGGFPLNFARGLVILLCWLALITTLGLTMSSFFSFPVAAFVSIAMLIIFFSGGLVDAVVENNTVTSIDYNQDVPTRDYPVLDYIFMPFFHGLNWLIKLVTDFSPVESLSDGRSVSWFETFKAVVQIVFVACGFLGAFGIYGLARRELARPQNMS